MKQNYELSYLISSQSDQDQANALAVKINDFLPENNGLIFENQLPRKINLAYLIKKENTAWLQTIYFSLEPAQTESLAKKLQETKEILRFLILKRLLLKRLKPRRKPKEKTKTIETATTPPKVELKEIEKKLDEILK
jgi:ribosomal protein S6